MNLLPNKDFVLMPDPSDDKHLAIGIRTGPYDGVVFRFDRVAPVDAGATAEVSFSYTILQQPFSVDREDFNDWAGNILNSLLLEYSAGN